MKTKVTFSYLKKLNAIVDCPCGCRTSIKNELFGIEQRKLNWHLQMTCNYIMGKYHYHDANNGNRLHYLELANEAFSNIFVIANSSRDVQVNNPKHFFKTAHTKYALSKLVADKEDAKALHAKAKEICCAGLKVSPKNKSLLWLSSELNR